MSILVKIYTKAPDAPGAFFVPPTASRAEERTMVVVMSTDATPEQIDAVVARVTDGGGDAFVSRGVSRTIIGLVGDVELFHSLELSAMPGVTDVVL